jgi:hypothetical protein
MFLMMDIGGGNMGKRQWRTANTPGLLVINLIKLLIIILKQQQKKTKNPCII